MISARKIFLILAGGAIVLYVGLYFYFYSIQDDRFKSTELSPDYTYTFNESFEELNFKCEDGGVINALLFKAGKSRGVVCFWKGNGGNLAKWGLMARRFLPYNYDVLIADYRQHGKSRGNITIENFFSDAQTVYDFLKTRYEEEQIVVAGYSLGASIASHLSSENMPSRTILIEPRANTEDRYLELFFLPFPTINRFPFRTDLDLGKMKTPVWIISGTRSAIYQDALQLRKLLHDKDHFFEIQGADHGGVLAGDDLDRILAELLL